MGTGCVTPISRSLFMLLSGEMQKYDVWWKEMVYLNQSLSHVWFKKFPFHFKIWVEAVAVKVKAGRGCVKQAPLLHPHPPLSIQCNLIVHQPCHSSSEFFLRQHGDIIYTNKSTLGSQLTTFSILRPHWVLINTKCFRVNFKQTTGFRGFQRHINFI